MVAHLEEMPNSATVAKLDVEQPGDRPQLPGRSRSPFLIGSRIAASKRTAGASRLRAASFTFPTSTSPGASASDSDNTLLGIVNDELIPEGLLVCRVRRDLAMPWHAVRLSLR